MAIDPDVQVLLDAIEARLDALEAAPPEPEPEPEPDDLRWPLPDTTGWDRRPLTIGTTYIDGDTVLEYQGTPLPESVRLVPRNPDARVVITGARWNITDRSLSKPRHMAIQIAGAGTALSELWVTDAYMEGRALIEGIQMGAQVGTLTVQRWYCGPLFGGHNTNAPHGEWGHSPNHADVMQQYNPDGLGLLRADRVYAHLDGGGDSKFWQGYVDWVELHNSDIICSQGPVNPDTHDGGTRNNWFLHQTDWQMSEDRWDCSNTYVEPNRDPDVYDNWWTHVFPDGVTEGLRDGGSFYRPGD